MHDRFPLVMTVLSLLFIFVLLLATISDKRCFSSDLDPELRVKICN